MCQNGWYTKVATSSTMEIRVFKPQNEKLKQYIECFYTLKNSRNSNISYITFPSVYTIVAILTNARFEINNNQITTQESTSRRFASSIVAHFQSPITFTYKGLINEITIYFKPGGINAFLDKPLSSFNKTDFNYFNPFADYKTNMVSVLNQKTDKGKILALEKYLLSKCKNEVNNTLRQIIDTMLNTTVESNYCIHELSKKFKTSRKTIHKLFIDYVGKSPIEFKKTVRFRQALERGTSPEILKFFTGIAHNANYYDQSHMLKDFKSLTNQSPKAFFKSLSTIHDKTIFWQLM
jgi:AraC-like DNA-binding protein